MSKGLIIMQNGRETVVPNTAGTRKFWEDYNTHIQKSKIAHKKFVTILEADPETIARCLTPKVVRTTTVVQGASKAENDALRAELSELKSIILRMQLSRPGAPVLPTVNPGETVMVPIAGNENGFENFD